MKVRTLSRRQVLLGTGGFALGLPWLPSLLPRELKAAPMPGERRFVAFATDHGAVLETAMYPADALFSQNQDLYAGHSVRRGALTATTSDGETRLSNVLRAPSSMLTESLVSKMNVLRGLDIPFYIAHHTGGHLGNYARNDGNGSDGMAAQMAMMPTVDQLMAWSSSFYEDLTGITERAMIFGGYRLSYNWSNPSDRTGEIQEVTGDADPLTMFNKVFIPEEVPDPDAPEPRPPIVDRVFENYQSLRQSDRRLSQGDLQRLDDHMDRLAELQRKLNVDAVRRASCGTSPAPMGDPSDVRQYYAMVNDVITAAFLCGTSRIAVVKVRESEFTTYVGDWHQEIAHQWQLPESQVRLQEVNQAAFQHSICDLASKLDVEEAPGENVLDSALLQWTQESGEATHDSRSMPTVTFGGARGSLSTGHYCDYRKRTPEGMAQAYGSDFGYTGLLYSQWLAQVLGAMQVPASEFQNIPNNGAAGYGYAFVDGVYDPTHSDGVVESASDPLPFLAG